MFHTRKDFRIIQIWFNFGKYLSFSPLNIRTSTQKNCNHLIPRLYPTFLALFYLACTVFSFYERFYIYQQHFNISQAILDAFQGLTELFFIEYIVLSSIWKGKRWSKLVRSVTQLESRLNWNLKGSVEDSKWSCIKLKIFLLHLAYVAIHIYDTVVNWTDISYSLAFVIYRFTTYYMMFSTLFVIFLCTWLKNRYDYLENCLRNCAVPKKFKIAFLEGRVECACEVFKEFTRNYKSLYLIVEEFNGIFGWQIFFIAICTVLEILNAVNYGMPTGNNKELNGDVVGVNVIFPTVYVICHTVLVMACDSVEKSGLKIWKTTLILYENSENLDLKEELFKIASLAQGLCPEIYAAGFWTVNQAVLSTLFSSVMTYLIIIIQFNMTLK